jgi:hypothetical protein
LYDHQKSYSVKQTTENWLNNPKTDCPEDLRDKVKEVTWQMRNQKPYVERPKPVTIVTQPKVTKAPAKKTTKAPVRKTTQKRK